MKTIQSYIGMVNKMDWRITYEDISNRISGFRG